MVDSINRFWNLRDTTSGSFVLPIFYDIYGVNEFYVVRGNITQFDKLSLT